MFQDETLNLLKQLYQWLIVDPSKIDETRYLLLKKFSEVDSKPETCAWAG